MTLEQHVVLAVVIGLRLVVPLFIPRFPLPALIAALVVDGVDQTIFQWFHVTAILDTYQGYDKALDVYYLVIAYTATMRNWHDDVAFRIGQVLWYWRLIGVVAFEYGGWGPLLLIFPNAFEYFVIAYEAVRTRWRPNRLSDRQLLGLAAFVVIVIKIPQETWIHVLNLDVTDEMTAHPAMAVVVFALLAVVVGGICATTLKNAPAPDWRFCVDVDRHQVRKRPDTRPEGWRSLLHATGEKAALVSMVVVTFGHLLASSAGAGGGALALGVCVVVVLNAGVTEWLEERRMVPQPIWGRFGVGVVINAVIFETLVLVGPTVSVNRVTAAVLLLELTLIVTLYDYFRSVSYGIPVDLPGSSTDTATSPAT